MKMAKATPEDIKTVLDLVSILEVIEKYGQFPSDDDDPPRFDRFNQEHMARAFSMVMDIIERNPGGMFRVAFGYQAIIDNNVLDPGVDFLKINPAMQEAFDKMKTQEEKEEKTNGKPE